MTRTYSMKTGRNDANNRPTPARTPRDRLSRAQRKLPNWLALGLLAAGSFGATFGLVAWSRLPKTMPLDGPPGMAWIPGGEFTMGTDSDLGWASEKPAHRVRVDGFWMDETDVTNAQFRKFVEATGYLTTAEKPPDVAELMK